MRYSFITKNQSNTRLIAVFLGWAMDEKPFESLRREGYDIVVFYGYGDGQEPAPVYADVTSSYDEVSVIAWSFGVVIANSLLSQAESQCIAVNGTVFPVDDKNGIPRHVYAITLRMLNCANLRKFYESTGFTDCMAKPERDIDELRDELAMFGQMGQQEVSQRWQIAHIADNDKIMPSANQRFFWQNRCRVITDKGGHLPNLQSIIDNDIVDKRLIARRFSVNAESYDCNAAVQKLVAQRLFETINRHFDVSGKKVFEAGCGTGFLTRLYAAADLSAESIAVDLADNKTLSDIFKRNEISYNGRIVSGDAEKIIDDADDESFDAVFSSSTIQWFGDLRKFFTNVARVLKPGGTAAFSTFLPGTFAEIQTASGRSLNFTSDEELLGMLPDNLKVVERDSENIADGFKNGRELMSHVKMTGVNAVGASTGYGETKRLIAALDANPKLTYNVFYIVLRKES